MVHYAILCGSAPENFRQKKLEDFHNSLERSGEYQPENIVVFPNGANELFLEMVLNETFDKICDGDTGEEDIIGGLLLYVCTRTKADLSAELSDCAVPGVEVVLLGEDEVRKEVIAYYEDLAEKMGVGFRVEYDWDGEFVREEELGYERVLTEKAGECLN